jgi:RHS repeat-associated protein
VSREYGGNGTIASLERETLHVMDDKQRIALVETRTEGSDRSLQQAVRYQFSNHLGSASLEVDDHAQIISYEEYYPHGSTSYQAVSSQTDTLKRYRFTAMERDEETGLQYHSARYYPPWLGRWISTDPAGLIEQSNLYLFVRGNPVALIDMTGKEGVPSPNLVPFRYIPAPATTPAAPPVAPPAAAPEAAAGEAAAGEAAAGEGAGAGGAGVGSSITSTVAIVAALALATENWMHRSGQLARYGNPWGLHGGSRGLPLAGGGPYPLPLPSRDPSPKREARPQPTPAPDPTPEPRTRDDDRRRRPNLGRIYVTYLKIQDETGLVYVGRTDMVVNLDEPLKHKRYWPCIHGV